MTESSWRSLFLASGCDGSVFSFLVFSACSGMYLASEYDRSAFREGSGRR